MDALPVCMVMNKSKTHPLHVSSIHKILIITGNAQEKNMQSQDGTKVNFGLTHIMLLNTERCVTYLVLVAQDLYTQQLVCFSATWRLCAGE